ncbi:MAG: hypothetical protein OXU61_01550 [Gammaproteobacteria bacterium]|nr:hypothetical protein [Gammaproteobacteria bacterium]
MAGSGLCSTARDRWEPAGLASARPLPGIVALGAGSGYSRGHVRYSRMSFVVVADGRPRPGLAVPAPAVALTGQPDSTHNLYAPRRAWPPEWLEGARARRAPGGAVNYRPGAKAPDALRKTSLRRTKLGEGT